MTTPERNRPSFARGAAVAGLGLAVLIGARMVGGDAPATGVGLRALPPLAGTALVVLGLLFMMAAGRVFPEAARPGRRGVLPWIMGGLVGGVVSVEWLGFPLAAAWVFALTARGFGSRRWLRNALVGAALGLFVYLIVAVGLGTALPGGPLGVLGRRP